MIFVREVPTSYIIELLNLVLKGNIFELNGHVYKQNVGAAMGAKSLVTYANVFMWWLETNMLLKAWKGTKPTMYKRFLDDLFFVWTSTEEELLKLIRHFNTIHKYIKFTANYNTESKRIPFLDTEVYID